MILIVAGVAGSGKSTVGVLLADRLRWRFADADGFHPEASIAKMRAGIPLTDADRQPWLHAVAAWIDERIAAGQSGVVACSALKRAHRDLLLDGRPAASMVFLQVTRDVLERRLRSRQDHFFPERLLDSQLADLELPAPDERVLTVLAEGDSARTAAKVIAALWPNGGEPPCHEGARLTPEAGELAWSGETQAGPARHLQPGWRDREGAAAGLR